MLLFSTNHKPSDFRTLLRLRMRWGPMKTRTKRLVNISNNHLNHLVSGPLISIQKNEDYLIED